MGLFKWQSKSNQKRIEDYLTLLCVETPHIAAEVLNQPIRDMTHWLTAANGEGTHHVERAVCGCLIGASLLALIQVEPDAYRPWEFVHDALITSLHNVDGDFGGMTSIDIGLVGHAVYHEVYEAVVYSPNHFDSAAEWRDAINERELALVFKLKNIIRKNLGIPQLTKPE